jgi:hypothetical protein
MPERRLISFEALRADCEHYWWSLAAGQHCCHSRRWSDDIRCMAENCPIWARLERKQPGPCSTPCTPGSTWTRPRSCATGLTR